MLANRPLGEGSWLLPLVTPTLPPATATNSLIVGGDRLLVIEPATPHPGERAKLDALLAELRSEGREIVGIVLTHHHVDHVGYAEALRERLAVPVLAHPDTASRLRFAVDQTIDEGWTIDLGSGHVVEVVHTPGHAPGHLVIWDRATDLAHVGDLVAGEGTILVDPRDAGSMRLYLASLRRMQALVRARADASGRMPAFVPAHGPVLEQPIALLERYVNHRLMREDKVRRAVLDGARTFEAILAAAYADTPKHVWPLAAMSLEAHLQKLVEDNELVREGMGARPLE